MLLTFDYICAGSGLQPLGGLQMAAAIAVGYGLFQYGFRRLATFAALAGHAQVALQVTHARGTAGHGIADLMIGDLITDADVHNCVTAPCCIKRYLIKLVHMIITII